ncbi:hypothetical protein [Blastococcus sp. SYSU DS0541]
MISERQFRLALKRGLPVIIGTALLTGAAAAAVSVLLPPSYVATQELTVVAPLVPAGNAGGESSQVRRLTTSAALLVSDSVLHRAVDGGTGDVEELRESVSVETDSDSDLLTISLVDGDEASAVDTLSTIVSSARQLEVATEQARIQAALEGVDRDIADVAGDDDAAAVYLSGLRDTRVGLLAALSSLTPSMQPVAEPSVRATSVGPSLPVAIAVGVVAGGLLGASWIVLGTRFRPRVLHGEDVRALGLPVVAGPDDSVAQAARRISNLSFTASGEARSLVLVMLGRAEALVDHVVQISTRMETPLRIVKVDGGDAWNESVPLDESVVVSRLSEEDVFSSTFERETAGAPGRPVITTVSASDEVIVRAGSIVGAAVLVVPVGSDAAPLQRVSTALRESGVDVVGVVVMGRRSTRSDKGSRADVQPLESSRS